MTEHGVIVLARHSTKYHKRNQHSALLKIIYFSNILFYVEEAKSPLD